MVNKDYQICFERQPHKVVVRLRAALKWTG